MKDETLIRMVNQIAAFFAPYPRDEAVAGIADHLAKYWDPRMRAKLFDLLDRGAEGLDPLARQAAEQLKASAA